MPLSPLIEFLASLRAPNGDALLQSGWSQVIVPVFPPNTVLRVTTSPEPLYVATIGFRSQFNAVPNAFTSVIIQSGFTPVSGIGTQDLLDHGVDYFIITTVQQQQQLTFTNTSLLNQRFELNAAFLGVPSLDNLKLVLDHLRLVSTQSELLKTMGLTLEAVKGVLRQLERLEAVLRGTV